MKSVDIAAWDRKEIYDLFSACDHPFYSVSFELDVTNLYAHTHESGLSFYYSLCYLMTRAMEEVEAFRMRIRDGRIDIVDELIPSCTDLVPGQAVSVYIKNILPEKMKIKLVIVNHALSQRHRFELKYFITEGHLDHWVYSTPESPKRIETDFAAAACNPA